MSMRNSRTCANCGHHLARNPNKPKTWIHDGLGGVKKCPEGKGTAAPEPVYVPEAITMVMVGHMIYRRCKAFRTDWDVELHGDKWECYRQGVGAVTMDWLLENWDVWVITKEGML